MKEIGKGKGKGRERKGNLVRNISGIKIIDEKEISPEVRSGVIDGMVDKEPERRRAKDRHERNVSEHDKAVNRKDPPYSVEVHQNPFHSFPVNQSFIEEITAKESAQKEERIHRKYPRNWHLRPKLFHYVLVCIPYVDFGFFSF